MIFLSEQPLEMNYKKKRKIRARANDYGSVRWSCVTIGPESLPWACKSPQTDVGWRHRRLNQQYQSVYSQRE
jgi:hypothetical protein